MDKIKKNTRSKVWIIVATIVLVLALAFDLYWFINMPNDFLPIFVYTVVMLVSAAVLVDGIIKVIKEDRNEVEERYTEIFSLLKSTIDNKQEVLERFEGVEKRIVDEIVYNQKVAAKIGVDRTIESAEELIGKLEDLQDTIEDKLAKSIKNDIIETVKLIVSDTVNSALLNNIRIVAPVNNEVNVKPDTIAESAPVEEVTGGPVSELDSETEGMLNSLLDEFDTSNEIETNEFADDSEMDDLISEITMDDDISINSALEKIEEKMHGAVADDEEVPEPAVSEPTVPEPAVEVPLATPVENTDDPNRKMTPDEIAALIASMQ